MIARPNVRRAVIGPWRAVSGRSGCGFGQQLGNALRVAEALEARDEVVDEPDAPRGADPVCELQGLGRGGRGEVRLLAVS